MKDYMLFFLGMKLERNLKAACRMYLSKNNLPKNDNNNNNNMNSAS